MSSTVLNKPESIGVKSNDERRNRLVAKIAKAEGAIVVAEHDVDEDTARVMKSPPEKHEACVSLLSISRGAEASAKRRKDTLERALPAFDVQPDEEDIRWARQNRAKLWRILNEIGVRPSQTDAVVKAIRDARKASKILAESPTQPSPDESQSA